MAPPGQRGAPAGSVVLAVHGGAGAAPPAEVAAEAAQGLRSALAAGQAVLARGGPALDAVIEAVAMLEDCAVLNAGRGSVLTSDGRVQMDAAVMEGTGGRAGAIAGLTRIRHPVRAARAVLERTPHVLLAGPDAEAFAVESGCAEAPPEHFVTAHRRAALARALARRAPSPDDGAGSGGGTVGAVARDGAGHLAAATSTGGVTAKRPGRLSDSCQIGAGTWARDATCAVSATGDGELFVRAAFAHEVDALLRHAGLPLEEACRRALAAVRALGGSGGCIAVDAAGRVALPFDTPAMHRGWLGADGAAHVAAGPQGA